jgi:hypothetical protein
VRKRACCVQVLLIALALSIMGALNWWYTATVNSYLETDFSNFWLAGHMVAAGQNPFSTSAWRLALAATGAFPFNTRFQYPPWSAVMLTPLGVLPFHLAITLFLVLAETSLIGIFWLGKRLVEWHTYPRASLYLFALITLLFRPVLITFILGQTALLWLLAVLVSIWLIRNQRDFWGGMLLALLLFKPQLAIFPMLAVCGWACWTRRWAIVYGAAGGVGALLLLSAPLLVLSWSDWIQEIIGEKAQDVQVCPTIWGLIYHLLAPAGPQALSHWYVPLSLMLSLFIFGGSVILLARIHWKRLLSPHILLLLDVSLGLILSVTVIPYAHSYDQAILLAPFLLGYALTQVETIPHRTLARLFRWTLMGAVTALPAFLFVLSLVLQADNWSLIEPVALLLLLIGVCSLLPTHPSSPPANAHNETVLEATLRPG